MNDSASLAKGTKTFIPFLKQVYFGLLLEACFYFFLTCWLRGRACRPYDMDLASGAPAHRVSTDVPQELLVSKITCPGATAWMRMEDNGFLLEPRSVLQIFWLVPHGFERFIYWTLPLYFWAPLALACLSVRKYNVPHQLCPAWTNTLTGEEKKPESKKIEVLIIPLRGSKHVKITLALAAFGLYSCREDWAAGRATVGSSKLQGSLGTVSDSVIPGTITEHKAQEHSLCNQKYRWAVLLLWAQHRTKPTSLTHFFLLNFLQIA